MSDNEITSGIFDLSVTSATSVTACFDAGLGDTDGLVQSVTAVTKPINDGGADAFPKDIRFNGFKTYWKPVDVDGVNFPQGLYRHYYIQPTEKKEGGWVHQRVCTPLQVLAVTADTHKENHGRLIEFTLGNYGPIRRLSVPMSLFAGSGEEFRSILLSRGVIIEPRSKALLNEFFAWKEPKTKLTCATQTGWHGDVFVLPDESFGANAAKVVFQSGEVSSPEYVRAGTLAEWQHEVARYAEGNPVAILALCVGFSGVLLKPANQDGGGVHFVGPSSVGKTTLLELASSIWGGENFKRSWKTTANGLEGACALFNDALLCLDEISEANPSEVGSIVYALGNGRGKQRASRSGAARAVTQWHCSVVSTGERSIGATIAEAGKAAKAGQEVRLIEVPIQQTHGCWDNLHGFSVGAELSNHIKSATKRYHGTAGREFLERITHDLAQIDFFRLISEIKKAFPIDSNDGQSDRVAQRFALFAAAGVLASEYGMLPIAQSEITSACVATYNAWKATRGKGQSEQNVLLNRLLDFIDAYSDSRFTSIHPNDVYREPTVRTGLKRAGYFRCDGDDTEYCLLSEAFQEAVGTSGRSDTKRAAEALFKTGVLLYEAGSKTVKVAAKTTRVYIVSRNRLMEAIDELN